MKVSELTGPALDWAVAKCEGLAPEITEHRTVEGAFQVLVGNRLVYPPSINWAQGGPIIEREIDFYEKLPTGIFCADIHKTLTRQFGPTSLIAAMRCYVASKFGDEVEVPDDLR